MGDLRNQPSGARETAAEVEWTSEFRPAFGADGLIPAIISDAGTGAVLMLAFMNRDALALSLKTKEAHFWSRSRQAIWRKGEISGNSLSIVEMRTDCDQDALWLKVTISGDGVACHTKEKSCFYRAVSLDAAPSAGHSHPLTTREI